MSPHPSNVYNTRVKEKTGLSSGFRMMQSFSALEEKRVQDSPHILASVEFIHYLKMHKSWMTG